MARIVKAHSVRRDEILEVAQQLISTKGYEQMMIQDIVNELQIAKDTVYHYFASKVALLEALIERNLEEIEQFLLPIVYDPTLPVLEKFQNFFALLNSQRDTQKPLLLELLRVWYADDNALVRQKTHMVLVKRIKPLLATIVRQGVQEGILTTSYPDQASEFILVLQQSLEETLAKLLLSELKPENLHSMESTVAAYIDALERMLGAPRDSLHPVDIETLRKWMIPPGVELC